ncbi:hypothetical protein K3495_g16040 [Podosphaera aphanis]|nr:hypothetical protein K3495_g16040 [Podosphaera aphanis]
MVVHQITSKSDFDSTIKSHKLVLLDAYADWCGPCKAIAPRINQFSTEYSDVRFIKVDVEAVPDITTALNIRAMPYFIFFKDGEKVAEVVGAHPVDIDEKLRALISSN